MPLSPITVVTVTFGAETALLEVQARSLARSLAPGDVAEIIVIDNGRRAMGTATAARLRARYGPLASRVRILPVAELVPDMPAAIGWRTQQVAKLVVAAEVETPHYLILDAKNHLIRPAGLPDLVGEDGRAHGSTHPYTSHPLQAQLRTTLAYLGADAEQTRDAIANFPPTATPFVMDTALTRALVDDISRRARTPFAIEFERAGLTEFFLYAGWVQLRGPGLEAVFDGTPIPSPTVWPKARTAAGLDAVIAEASLSRSAFFAVHRTALARGDAALRSALARFWVGCGLFPDERAARAAIRRFRLKYYPEMAAKRIGEKLGRS
ncbi:MAG: hypothetical protein DI534_13590 [Leifsonia xyli]|nr:MAG: hypothetical protein DI534_13590 [Leifsonia xyli]